MRSRLRVMTLPSGPIVTPVLAADADASMSFISARSGFSSCPLRFSTFSLDCRLSVSKIEEDPREPRVGVSPFMPGLAVRLAFFR